jgi:hypothetical protein
VLILRLVQQPRPVVDPTLLTRLPRNVLLSSNSKLSCAWLNVSLPWELRPLPRLARPRNNGLSARSESAKRNFVKLKRKMLAVKKSVREGSMTNQPHLRHQSREVARSQHLLHQPHARTRPRLRSTTSSKPRQKPREQRMTWPRKLYATNRRRRRRRPSTWSTYRHLILLDYC